MNIKHTTKLCLFSCITMLLAGCSLQQNIVSSKETKSDVIAFLSEEHTGEEIETKLTESFKHLSKEENTEIIDLYLHATYSLANQELIDDETANILYSVMDSEKQFDFTKITDDEIKAACEELQRQHIVPRFCNGNLFFDVDYPYFIETYREYLNDDYVALISLYSDEKIYDYYNPETDLMNYDIVESRLNSAYQLMKTYPNSDLMASMQDYYNFYKCVYLGAYSQDYVYDSGIKIKDDLFAKYKDYVLITKDDELQKFMEELITMYDQSDLSRTESIYSKIKIHCGIEEAKEYESGSESGS